ncbi:MAG: FAD-dependent oxidoreductase [Cyanobacteria bacterium]|nr:FAD-dependent oxidoreductase [Cyanobacteriota bacterium]
MAEPYIKSDLAADSQDVSAYVGIIDLEDLNHKRYLLPGGNGYVVKRFAEEINQAASKDQDLVAAYEGKSPIQTEKVLEWLEQDKDKVYLKYRDANDELHVISADHVLMAAPYHTIPKLMKVPKKTEALMTSIPKSSYSIVSIYLKNSPLRSHQFYMLPESKTISDLVITPLNPGKDREPKENEPSVMSIYLAHTGRVRKLENFKQEILDEIKATFPEITDDIVTGIEVHPFKHSMAAPSPGQVKALKEMNRTYRNVTFINSDGGAVPSILTAVSEALNGTEKMKAKQEKSLKATAE